MTLAPRYSSAWSEVSARVQARQQVNLLFVAASIALYSATFSGAGLCSNPIGWHIVSTLSPAMVWCYCLWVRAHEIIIGLLANYMVSLECYDHANNCSGKKQIPSFHDKTHGRIDFGLRARTNTDYATAICVLIASFPPFYIAFINEVNSSECLRGYAFLCFLVSIIGVPYTLWNRKIRNDLIALQ